MVIHTHLVTFAIVANMMEVPRSNRVSNRRPPEDASYQPSNPLNNDEDATENHSEVLFDSEDEEMLRYDESTTEDHPEALFDSGDEEMLGYEEIVVAGHIMMVEKRAPMPTHHEFYMDLFYGTAVLTRPNASVGLPDSNKTRTDADMISHSSNSRKPVWQPRTFVGRMRCHVSLLKSTGTTSWTRRRS